MINFDFRPRTRIVFGKDSIDQLGSLASDLGAKRALVITDPGIVAAGHVQRGLDSLRKSHIDTLLFDGARENPTTDDVDAGLKMAVRYEPELLIGLGGGSSMDCAKGVNFLYSNGGQMQDYWGVGKAEKDMLPMIAVPTTAGTGSEMQSFALISDSQTHVKMACGDPKASCRIAILDPLLTLTQPAQVTALTGIDALSHAVETYVTKKRNELSLLFSREAFRLLAGNFQHVLNDPEDIDARASMQLGAAYSGLAIENSMLGASHALANPLTAEYGISHGQAVGLMLPHVVRFNGRECNAWYQELFSVIEGMPGGPTVGGGAYDLADFLTQMVKAAGLEVKLEALGVQRDKLSDLAADAAKQWTGGFNPRRVDQDSLNEMYEQAF
ncbi:MAG: iron-containing alcohol dehydrogenase [Mariniblastus sp.]|nr:iron-containing alcohol dehydrogenase [Mariniblastus sp.]